MSLFIFCLCRLTVKLSSSCRCLRSSARVCRRRRAIVTLRSVCVSHLLPALPEDSLTHLRSGTRSSAKRVPQPLTDTPPYVVRWLFIKIKRRSTVSSTGLRRDLLSCPQVRNQSHRHSSKCCCVSSSSPPCSSPTANVAMSPAN